jgi:hypothetical protein
VPELVQYDNTKDGEDERDSSEYRRGGVLCLIRREGDPREEQQERRVHVYVDPGKASDTPRPSHVLMPLE